MAGKPSNNPFKGTAFCHNESMFKDFNSTAVASQVITTSFSMLFYLAILVLSVLGVYFKSVVKLFSSHAMFIFFLIGLITSPLSVFNASGRSTVTLYERIVTVFLVGIFFVLFGAVLFFKKPSCNPSNHLGLHQPSMGLLLTIITLPLNATELLILVTFRTVADTMERYLWLLHVVDEAVFFVQKFIQVAVYVWLRGLEVRDSYRENAQFYFKVLAFFNFIEWLDAQVVLDRGINVTRANEVYGEWFEILYGLYKALLIDYRLLCSLLFLEHFIQVKNETEGAEIAEAGNTEVTNHRVSTTSTNLQNRNIGFIVGFSCLLAPLICALYYVRELNLSVYTRTAVTFLNSLVILVCGMVLLRKNDLNFDKRDTESNGVKIMVSDSVNLTEQIFSFSFNSRIETLIKERCSICVLRVNE